MEKYRIQRAPRWKDNVYNYGSEFVKRMACIQSGGIEACTHKVLLEKAQEIADIEEVFRILSAHRYAWVIGESSESWEREYITFIVWLYSSCGFQGPEQLFNGWKKGRNPFEPSIIPCSDCRSEDWDGIEDWSAWKRNFDDCLSLNYIYSDEQGYLVPDAKKVKELVQKYREIGYPWKEHNLSVMKEKIQSGDLCGAIGIKPRHVKLTEPMPTWRDILKYELKLGCILPRSLVRVLKRGGDLEGKNVVRGPWSDCGFMEFGILPPWNFAEESKKIKKVWCGRRGIIPFAIAGGDDPSDCLAISYWRPGVPCGAVVYMDNEDYVPVTMVASSFDEFLNMIEPLDEWEDLPEEEMDRLTTFTDEERAQVRIARPIPFLPDPKDDIDNW